MLILAHRGNIRGPSTANFQECVRRGFGAELDLRYDPDGFYFDHDPQGWWPATDARTVLRKLEKVPLAINIKETGHEHDAVEVLKGHPDCFVFDMELCGADPYAFHKLPRAARISDKKSERRPQFMSDYIWLDEFEPWVTEDVMKNLTSWRDMVDWQQHGPPRRVFWVSPELHMPVKTTADMQHTENRWSDMLAWGVDGICTDYPAILAERMGEWGWNVKVEYGALV